jgi:low affinity Fe/Cu permease
MSPVSANATRSSHEAHRITGRPRTYSLTSRRLTRWVGSVRWVLALGAVTVMWLVVGVITEYPRWWELVVTMGFPFLTLLFLGLVQHTQNHNANAIELKLDELLSSLESPSDAMIRIEEASEADLEQLQEHFSRRSEAAQGQVE